MGLEKSLATRLLSAHPDDAAAELESMSEEVAAGTLSEAPSAMAAGVLARLAPNRGALVLSRLEQSFAREVVDHLGLDDAARLIRRMDPEPMERFITSLEADTARHVRTLLQFREGTAGALMDSRVLALPLDVTTGQAIDQIRKTPDNIRYNLYVVDREHRLVGVLNLRELLLADRKHTLGAIARREVMSIEGHEGRSAVLAHRAWREAHSLPVVDRKGVYLGAIRYRTWRQLFERSGQLKAPTDATAADALGELFSTGVAGVVGALVEVASSPHRSSDR